MSNTGEVVVDFGSMKEPSQEKYIGTAGIWRNATINSFGVAPVKLKDTTKPESATNKKTGGWLEMILETEKDGKFTMRMFPLPKTPADVKFVGKHYDEKGTEIRDKTHAEQMQDDYTSFSYFLIQVAMALGNDFDNAKRVVSGLPGTFEGKIDGFKAAFLKTFPTTQKVDFKTVWQNSDKNKTSYLQMPKAGYGNIIITKATNAPASTIQFTAYEKQKQLNEKYPFSRKATTDAAGTAGGGVESGATGWKPPIEEKSDGELF